MTMIAEEDYQPGDEFDWDINDRSQRCKHGTFIGSSWGPDLLCGFCEDGTTDEEYTEYIEYIERRDHTRMVMPRLFDLAIKNANHTNRMQDTDWWHAWGRLYKEGV